MRKFAVLSVSTFWVVLMSISSAQDAAAQTLVPCSERPTALSEPWIPSGMACLERVLEDSSAGELGYSALAAVPSVDSRDGALLYATRPWAGQVIALSDGDGDGLPETSTVLLEGLTLPNGLTYHEGALYISGGAHLYRWRAGVLTTLVDDLPTGEFWTGGVAILGDRLYVGIGARCDRCERSDEAEYGTVLSFTLGGEDRRVVARGLRFPAALTAFEGALYVGDSAADAAFAMPQQDEINRFVPTLNGDIPDFGFPACPGGVVRGGNPCTGEVSPFALLPTESIPTAMALYHSEALPALTGRLLVVLNGSRQQVELRGYRLVALDLVETVWAGTMNGVMPAQTLNDADSEFTPDEMSYRGSGFYPHRPLSVAVTDQGWVYLSIGGGRILALRP